MGRIRYTSDLHLNHPFVAKLRGFTRTDGYDAEGKPVIRGDVDAHDGTVIENFNKGTRKDDITIIAGDFAMNWKGVEAKLAQLEGRIILVNGNHDVTSPVQNGWKHQKRWTGEDRFEAIVDMLPRKLAGQEVLISHYPYIGEGERDIPDRYTQFRLRDEGRFLLHGHTHSRKRLSDHPRQIHIGLDAWDLRPVSEEAVIELMRHLDSQLADGEG